MKIEKKPLPVCSPEEMGLPSEAIYRYIQALNNQRLNMHDVLIAVDGKLVFETYWKPFDRDYLHRLYSCSKSIVSCAVGYLIGQGLLHLDDVCVDFFKDKAPKDVHPWLREMTIRDLLRMVTCYEFGASYSPEIPDWEASFFLSPVNHKPGQVFSYCTTASTMLCAIIRRVTGRNFTEVLRPVFDEIGVSDEIFCVKAPDGFEWGGSGVCATARDFMKIACLCLNYGKWNGKQLLPEDYMREATSVQIDNGAYHTMRDEDEGYGYQFWKIRDGFAMHGMGGQYALCIPEKKIVLITNGYDNLSRRSLCEIFCAFYREILPELKDGPIEPDLQAKKALSALTESLTVPLPAGETSSPMEKIVSGKTYRMEENRMNLRWIRFHFTENGGVMAYENATGVHELPFGRTEYARGPFPETHYCDRIIGTPAGRGLDSMTAAAWRKPDEMMIYCHIIDVCHGNLRIAVSFEDDTVTLLAHKDAEWYLTEYYGFASGRWE